MKTQEPRTDDISRKHSALKEPLIFAMSYNGTREPDCQGPVLTRFMDRPYPAQQITGL